jgi:hypothetical protein
MTESIQNEVAETFSRELRSFFVLCLMSLVFGSLALAFGMQFIVTALIAMAETGNFGISPFLQALAGWAAVVVGFRWILSSAGILKGVNPIRREYRAMEGSMAGEPRAEPVSGEVLTGLIIRMMAHYRENWKTILRMSLISTLGGWIFLVLGVMNLAQGISAPNPAPDLQYIFPFLAAGINLTIGLASLLFSSSFRRYSRAWERRLIEASHAEEALQESMGEG